MFTLLQLKKQFVAKNKLYVRDVREMLSLHRNQDRSTKTMENVRKERQALNGANQECVKETKPIQNQCVSKMHPNDITKTIRNIEHQNQGHQGARDDSNIFLIKTLVVWIFICLPGNIFAMTIFWKHGLKPHEQLIDHPLNISARVYIAFENDTLQPMEYTDETITGKENSQEAVS